MNRTTWHDAFMGLWVAALRLVQRVWFSSIDSHMIWSLNFHPILLGKGSDRRSSATCGHTLMLASVYHNSIDR